MTINFGGETITLLPQRAVFWGAESTLIFSDVHLGKAQSLQKVGIPISSSAHEEDLHTIGTLIHRWSPQHIVILGDFIHDVHSWSGDLIVQMRAFFQVHRHLSWTLVLGNHERGSEMPLKNLPIRLVSDHLQVRGINLAHGHAKKVSSVGKIEHRIEGHVHPVHAIREGSTRLRLPCFVQTKERLILPSFGTLTGGFEFEPLKQQHIFAVTPAEVFEVKGRN